uniref:Eukaryotic translation initiation factor 4 gamma 2 n=1 Tax=Schistocephalus solidus TaxID=70667 RepID=A0A0X3PCH2_SCHSO
MECLCQFLKVVGQHMDTEKARYLMDQYFERMRCILERGTSGHQSRPGDIKAGETASRPTAKGKSAGTKFLPLDTRIRFMMKDVIELRQNHWVPRYTGQQTESTKPKLLSEIRRELEAKSGTVLEPSRSERSPAHRDVPGSGYRPSDGSSPPFGPTGLASSRSSELWGTSAEADWMKLNQLSKALCSQRKELDLFGSSPPINGNYAYSKERSRQSLHNRNSRAVTPITGASSLLSNNSGAVCGNTFRRDISDDCRKVSNGGSGGARALNPGRMNDAFARFTGRDFETVSNGSSASSGSNGVWTRGVFLRGNSNNTPAGDNAMLSRFQRRTIGDQFHKPDQTTVPCMSSSGYFEPDHLSSKVVSGSHSSPSDSFTHSLLGQDASPGAKGTTRPASHDSFVSAPTAAGTGRQLSTVQYNSVSPAHSNRWNNPTDSLPAVKRPAINSNHPPASAQTISNKSLPQEDNKEVSKTIFFILESATDVASATAALQEKNLVSRFSKDVLLKLLLKFCSDYNSPLYLDQKGKFSACLLVSVLSEIQNSSSDFETIRASGLSTRQLTDEAKPSQTSLPNSLNSAWLKVVQSLSSTSIKTSLAFVIARLVLAGLLSLEEMAAPLAAGRHYPLFLLVLQQLSQMLESDATPGSFLSSSFVEDGDFIPVCGNGPLCDVFKQSKQERKRFLAEHFKNSKIDMEKMLPVGSQAPDRMLAVLEERALTFLVPGLQVAEELSRLLLSGLEATAGQPADASSPPLQPPPLSPQFATRLEAYLDGAEGNVTADFIHSLMAIVFQRILQLGVGILGASAPAEDLMALEKQAWKQLADANLRACFKDSPSHQLDALHALQIFWNDKAQPKGFLLRCFLNMYYLDLVDEATFLTWKEEVDQNYPAKGQALFEVIRWLLWLETAEEEEEEEEENKKNDEAVENAKSTDQSKEKDADSSHELESVARIETCTSQE